MFYFQIEKVEKAEKEEKKAKSKKSKKVSESDKVAPSSPAPVIENKPVEKVSSKKSEETKKKVEPVEATTKPVETEDKNAPVFDELGGEYKKLRYFH